MKKHRQAKLMNLGWKNEDRSELCLARKMKVGVENKTWSENEGRMENDV